jgi:hypothetical protein
LPRNCCLRASAEGAATRRVATQKVENLMMLFRRG